MLGAGIACQLMRTLVGRRVTQSFFETNSLARYSALIEQRGLLIVVLLRINPLTSSDLVSYAAGLTRLRVGTVMLGTAIGMAPLCFAQSYFAATLLDVFPWLVVPLIVLCVLYAVVLVAVLWRLRPEKHQDAESQSP